LRQQRAAQGLEELGVDHGVVLLCIQLVCAL
jgi:hypothetical protein